MPNMKGQEIRIDAISATQGVEPAIAGVVKSGEIQWDIEGLSEGYLGALTEEKDNIFTGISGNLEMNLRTADVLSFVDRVKLASQLRTPGESFQLVFTYNFPLGGTRRVVLADVKISNPNVSSPSRKDYVNFKFDLASDDAQILPSAA
jgi:hypothetical protein